MDVKGRPSLGSRLGNLFKSRKRMLSALGVEPTNRVEFCTLEAFAGAVVVLIAVASPSIRIVTDSVMVFVMVFALVFALVFVMVFVMVFVTVMVHIWFWSWRKSCS